MLVESCSNSFARQVTCEYTPKARYLIVEGYGQK